MGKPRYARLLTRRLKHSKPLTAKSLDGLLGQVVSSSDIVGLQEDQALHHRRVSPPMRFRRTDSARSQALPTPPSSTYTAAREHRFYTGRFRCSLDMSSCNGRPRGKTCPRQRNTFTTLVETFADKFGRIKKEWSLTGDITGTSTSTRSQVAPSTRTPSKGRWCH